MKKNYEIYEWRGWLLKNTGSQDRILRRWTYTIKNMDKTAQTHPRSSHYLLIGWEDKCNIVLLGEEHAKVVSVYAGVVCTHVKSWSGTIPATP